MKEKAEKITWSFVEKHDQVIISTALLLAPATTTSNQSYNDDNVGDVAKIIFISAKIK